MYKSLIHRLACGIFTLWMLSAALCAAELYQLRTWTSKAGTTLEARLVSTSFDKAKLEKNDGSLLEVPLALLSDEDLDYIKSINQPTAKPEVEKPVTVTAPKLPDDFPKDAAIASIPLLKKKSQTPIEFTFYDYRTKKQISSKSLRGKYVYVCAESFSSVNQAEMTRLKLLYDKYKAKGFEIIMIAPYGYDSSESMNRIYKGVRQAIDDYGADWYFSIHTKNGHNPLTEKFTTEFNFAWLLDPDGKLVHTNVPSYMVMANRVENRVMLTEALRRIFE